MNPPSRQFHIGSLSFRVDSATGMLRQLRFGPHEILRAVYPAVRDEAWATLPPQVGPLAVKRSDTSIEITFEARVLSGSVGLAWAVRITASADGTLGYHWDAQALTSFSTNRTGLCVLHPAELAGAPCAIEHSDGRRITGWFPTPVAPHQPFTQLRAIRHVVADGMEATVRMEGEVFEMEDQRNWSDASFKTYCRPLDWPRPYPITKDQQISHTVTVRVAGMAPSRPPQTAARFRVVASGGERIPLPQLGCTLTAPLPPALRERARALQLAHVRVEAAAGDLATVLPWAREEAAHLNCALELAVRGVSPAAPGALELPPESLLLVHDARGCSADEPTLHAWRPATAEALGTGSQHHFTELNRERPAVAAPHDVTVFGLNAQVHTFDDDSMLETLTQHPVLAANARRLGGERPVAATPIGLGPRSDSSDPRLQTEFGALWLLGSLAALTQAGVFHATYFRLHGAGGILDAGRRSPVEVLLLGLAGGCYAEPITIEPTPGDPPAWPSSLAALLVHVGDSRRLFVANLDANAVELEVPFSGQSARPGHSLQPFAPGIAHLPGRSVWQLNLSA